MMKTFSSQARQSPPDEARARGVTRPEQGICLPRRAHLFSLVEGCCRAMSLPNSTLPAAASPRLMVLMFTDLVNSTAIKEQIGNQADAQLLNRHDAFIRQALDVARGGRVLQDTGDGYFLSFDS